MAIFHLSSQIIKRSEGRSAVACAAYRSGEALHDEREGTTFKFQRSDRVVHSDIIAPDFATEPWATDRAQLWNSLEAVEKRKDAQLAKEIEVALPNGLPKRLQIELLKGWIEENFTQKGFIADFNIHHAPIGKPDNDHSHVMTTLRAIDPETGGWKKTKDRTFLDKTTDIELLRASWAKHVNSALEKAGIDDERVDHRSHKRRGITDVQPGLHVGYTGQGIEARGGRSWRADLNRQIRETNRILEDIKARAVATYRDLANRLASTSKKQEAAPAPIAAKPAPTIPATMPPPVIPADEAEKRKKAARIAAWTQQGGGGIGG